MATLQLIQAIQSGLVNPSTGVALASAKCRFYDIGTLTLQVVYSDSAGATPITQPLTLTAGGTGTVYTANPCRCVVKDASDVSTIYDIAAVNGTVPAAQFVTSSSFNGGSQTTLQTILDAVDDSFGGTDWKYKHSATATERNLKTWMGEDHVSALDYGAVGDDSTNNLTAIQNAINATPAGGTLMFPVGTYRFTGALTLPSTGIRIAGSGTRNTTVLKQMSTTANGFTITPVTGGAFTVFEGLTLSCGTSSTGTAVAALASGGTTSFIVCRDFAAVAGWTNSITNTTTGNLTALDRCSIGATGDAITGGGSGTLYAINSTIVSTGAKGITTYSVQYLSNSSVQGSTSGIDAALSTTLMASATTVTGGTAIGPSVSTLSVVASDLGTVTDTRIGSPVAFLLSGTGSVTPLPAKSPITKIVQSGAAAVTTINAPAAAPFGQLHTVICSNTSGGALTWTWNAAFKISAAVAPATGNRISVTFYRDSVDATWSEISRSAAVPN